MTLMKSYLIRAVRDWAIDNGYTPHIAVDASNPEAKVPMEYVDNGRIILNIHPRAVDDYEIQNEWLLLSARFGDRSRVLEIPVAAIRSIYARENGQGVAFPDELISQETCGGAASGVDESEAKGSHLRLIK